MPGLVQLPRDHPLVVAVVMATAPPAQKAGEQGRSLAGEAGEKDQGVGSQ